MKQVEVLVVGAGPVGAVGAARLASMGIDTVICEAQTSLSHDLRASTFHASTLEMLHEIDTAEPLIAMGLKAPVYHLRDRQSGDTLAFDLTELADMTRFPFRLQCEQTHLAELLTTRLAATGADRFQLGTALVHAREEGDRVIATLERDGQRFDVSAKFLIGADGARSPVRGLMGVGFEGFTWEEKFVSFSTRFPIEDHVPGLAYVNYISDPDEWLVLLRVPGLWRVLVPADGNETNDYLVSDENAAKVFARIVGDIPVETDHRTIYRVHQRVAESFVRGRMAIVGDAAHLNNPLGGFGMNSGVHDVWNLCDKLYAILRQDGDAEQLARFDRQRRSVTKSFIQAQTIENKAQMEGIGDRTRERMERIHADPALRRQYLLRQAMFESLAEAEAVL
ncbi:FAD-dependent monooxygenase [Polymorphobacter sp. PAMC 29334]|uniref:FAD-dependent oxidoreductase n=1 Tax=Polymorphobacter sp. PAMC 29334 TaxID=2862331 RepID=UPI001C6832C4|nr:FAD-dependent monooxygenase [Polymorphobacter sp. PAMC 29334]QYE33940.1 FAD-dependent monooxygenase [Polymorphobacter sp. PAMC 29334]